MKRVLFTTLFAMSIINCFAQTSFTAYKAGQEFDITVPTYMSRTTGLNKAAIIQFKNAAKDVYALVIQENKEELALAQLNFSSAEEFQEYTMKNFLKDVEQRKVSTPVIKEINGFKYVYAEASYYDKVIQQSVYYFYGIAESKTCFYKLLCYTSLNNKEKFKADFQNTFYSIHD